MKIIIKPRSSSSKKPVAVTPKQRTQWQQSHHIKHNYSMEDAFRLPEHETDDDGCTHA